MGKMKRIEWEKLNEKEALFTEHNCIIISANVMNSDPTMRTVLHHAGNLRKYFRIFFQIIRELCKAILKLQVCIFFRTNQAYMSAITLALIETDE